MLMFKKKILFSIILIASSISTISQNKTTTSDNQVWLGYLNQTRFSNKWGEWLDLHLRTKEDFVNNLG